MAQETPKKNWISARIEDVICIQETSNNSLEISNYRCYMKTRQQENGGGVAVLCKNDIESQEIKTEIKDTIVIRINLQCGESLFLINSYFPCKNRTNLWKSHKKNIENMIKSLKSKYVTPPIILTADINQPNIETLGDLYKINPAVSTHIRGHGIDYIMISNNLTPETTSVEEELLISDHKAIKAKIKGDFTLRRRKLRTINRKKANRILGSLIEKKKISKNFSGN